MLPYLILLFFVTMLLSIGALFKEVRRYTFFSTIVILIFFSGFAKGVGFDYFNYLELFDLIRLKYSVPLEYGYVVLIKTIIFFGGKYQLLVFVSSLLTNLLIGYFIYKNSPNPNLSLFIYVVLSIYYLATFTTIRQFIAVGLFAASLKLISEKRFWLYTLLMLIGSSVHVTLILLWPLYFVLRRKFKLYHYAIAFLLYTIGTNLITIVFKDILGYAHYFVKTDNSSNNMVLIAFGLIGMVLIFYKDRLFKVSAHAAIYINLIFFSILVITTIYISPIPSEIALRMSTYFNLSYLIIIPLFLKTIKNTNLRYLYLSVILSLFVSYFLYIIVNGAKYNLIPYTLDFNLF
ncbi:MAG: EpsG family protein [Pedobacter sp.]|nr:EpsG family protein [Pedobacter sp.]